MHGQQNITFSHGISRFLHLCYNTDTVQPHEHDGRALSAVVSRGEGMSDPHTRKNIATGNVREKTRQSAC